MELRDLLAISEQGLDASQTAVQLTKLQAGQREYPDEVEEHLKDLSSIKYFQATSDHTLVAAHGGAACSALSDGVCLQCNSVSVASRMCVLFFWGGGGIGQSTDVLSCF
jgi:hypothetical protein